LRWKKSILLLASLTLVSAVAVPAVLLSYPRTRDPEFPRGFYLGIAAGGDVAETKRLIDATRGLVNLIVFTNLEVTFNRTRLDEVADYAYRAGLSFYVYMVYPSPHANFTYDPFSWAHTAKHRYGEQFLGYYLWDEPGGNQLDLGNFRQFDKSTMPSSYREAANTFVYYLYIQMRDFIKIDKLVTSDYALYWYDYEAGYDAVFCQFGWNNSRALNVAQCRGAAEMHGKEWGVMVTWTFTEPPYLEDAEALYADMVTAYHAGAKYIVIFNNPSIGPLGLLTQNHLDALKAFKDYALRHPQNRTSNTKRVAYVLPENYGWGLRSPEDKIWGVWDADEKAAGIWRDINQLIDEYGCDFDIVVGSPWTRLFGKLHYDTLLWWNATDSHVKPNP